MTHEHAQSAGTSNDIAVIGMTCRFPGANSIAEYWQLLCEGVEGVTFFSAADADRSAFDGSVDFGHPSFVGAAGVIEGVDLFDAGFFGFAPGAAALIDPQQRLFLEHAWMALESAGYDPLRYEGAIGVFAGAQANMYRYHLLFQRAEAGGEMPVGGAIEDDFSCLSTRVAYLLNLRGPAYSVHTACSTGLAVVHLACQSLLMGECRMALAGGVAVQVPQRAGYVYREGGRFSPDGHCRVFDASAAGWALGSGVGVVVLKRLGDALADGDTIHAVIKGSAANNDGAGKASYAASSVSGQAAVIAAALAVAGVAPETVSYVEAHGAGTRLGDAVEIAALAQVFQGAEGIRHGCAVGSVKSNVGHLEAAAGMAGLIKVILALKHRQLPPSLHVSRLSPDLPFDQTPFYVNTTRVDWQPMYVPRRAGVSAFGVGGTNVHVVLEEAPAVPVGVSGNPWQVVLLSAKTSSALDQATLNLAAFFEGHADVALADVAYTLQVGRAHFAHRRFAVCHYAGDVGAVLRGEGTVGLFSGVSLMRDRPVVFMFAGQGAQHLAMAAELYEHEVPFREAFDRCADQLFRDLDVDLRQLLYARSEEEAAERLNQTEVAQPALFVVEYALAQFLMARGVHPQAMIGHSIGEYVAACLSGVMSLSDALWLVTMRGRMMQALPVGAMLTVSVAVSELQVPDDLDIAAVNADDMCVVAGPIESIEAFAQQLRRTRTPCRRLQTSHAFHSRMIAPMCEAFLQCFAQVTLHAPRIPYISNVSGTWIRAEEATDPRYWAEHARRAVLFARGLSELFALPNAVLLDVGPARPLSRLAQRHPARQPQHEVVATLRHPKDQQSDRECLALLFGRLWLAGVEVDWSSMYGDVHRRRVELPTYPFERERCWIDADVEGAAVAAPCVAPVVSGSGGQWLYAPGWQQTMPPRAGDAVQQAQRWLVFAVDGHAFVGQMIAELRAMVQTVVVVYPGAHYRCVTEDRYTINPGSCEDFALLAHALAALGKLPQVTLHLWSFAHEPVHPLTVQGFDGAQGCGFYSLLFFAQAFGAYSKVSPGLLAVISEQLYDVQGDEVLRPELATMLGPCLVIPQEFPQLACRNIDVVVPRAGEEQAALCERVLGEVGAGGEEAVVVLRGRHRWVPVFVPAQVTAGRSVSLRSGGVYVITGGLMGVGAVVAEFLARAVAARLVVLEAEPLPPRAMWESWLGSSDAQDAVRARILQVQALEAAGAQVCLVSADFSVLASVRAALEVGVAEFGPVQGVIHAATVLDGGGISVRAGDAIEQGFTVQARGAIHLHTLLRDAELDFFVLFSSINSVLGGFGQVDRCAAHSFLNMFAQAAGGCPLTSIVWEPWLSRGAALQGELLHLGLPLGAMEQVARVFDQGLGVEEGLACFQQVLAGPRMPQLVVSRQAPAVRLADVRRLLRDVFQGWSVCG